MDYAFGASANAKNDRSQCPGCRGHGLQSQCLLHVDAVRDECRCVEAVLSVAGLHFLGHDDERGLGGGNSERCCVYRTQ